MEVPQSWFKYRLPPFPSPTFHLFLIDLHQSSSDLNRLPGRGRPRSLPPSLKMALLSSARRECLDCLFRK